MSQLDAGVNRSGANSIFARVQGDSINQNLNQNLNQTQHQNKKARKFKYSLASWVANNDIKLVVFDKDGTLIEFHNYWSQWSKSIVGSLVELYNSLDHKQRKRVTRNRAAANRGDLYQEAFKCLGCDINTGKVNNQSGALCKGDMVLIKDDLLSFFKDYINIDNNFTDSHLNQYFEIFFNLAMDDISKHIRPVNRAANGSDNGSDNGLNIRELFQELELAGSQVAVFTSDVSYALDNALDALGVSDLVPDNLRLASDSSIERRFEKPSGEAINYLASQSGLLNPDQILMVGDSKGDVLSAQLAGVKSLFVETGLFTTDTLLSNNIRPHLKAKSVFDAVEKNLSSVYGGAFFNSNLNSASSSASSSDSNHALSSSSINNEL